MMHLCMCAIDVIDAADAGTTLGHLLGKKGDTLGFCYDLGDRWRHTITVAEVVPQAERNGKVVVLDGAMQCPPEDSNGARPSLIDWKRTHATSLRGRGQFEYERTSGQLCFTQGAVSAAAWVSHPAQLPGHRVRAHTRVRRRITPLACAQVWPAWVTRAIKSFWIF